MYDKIELKKGSVAMSKQEILNVINALPDSVSFDEVMYSLYVAANVEKGLKDIEEGKTYTQDEVREMFRR